jgi:hypothetical protein
MIQYIIRITFIFTFLTLFFFFYVIQTERNGFINQINIIVDDLLSNISSSNIINNQNIDQNNLKLLSDTIINSLEEKINIKLQSRVNQIDIDNDKIRHKAFTCLGILWAIFVFIIVSTGLNYNIITIIKYSLLILSIVILIKILFMYFISSKYISEDPNKIKEQIGISIKEWIATNIK